jgi:hypothetical protein
MKTLQKSNCRNMTGGERVVACYHGHLEKKTIFFLGLKRGKSASGDILGQKTRQKRRLATV